VLPRLGPVAVLSIASIVWGPCKAQSANAFQRLISYPVTSGASSVFAADFNADGKLDVLVEDQNDAVLTIFFGNGDGTFRPQSPLPQLGEFLTVGDVNGDGIPDLVTGQFTIGSVEVLLGNGDGSFRSSFQYVTTSGVYGLWLADLNHDGKPDLVATITDGTLDVFIATGNGNFLPPAVYSVSGGPIVSGDFNGDGNPDIAVATAPGDVSFLLGLGSGKLAAPIVQPFPTGGFMAVADFNGDGRSDLAVQGFFNKALGVFFGSAGKTFPVQAISESRSAIGVSAVDLDGDGLPDIVTTGPDGANVFMNAGAGMFVASAGFSATLLDSVTGDLNGDGKPDLITLETTATGSLLTVFLNEAAPWTATVTATPGSLAYPSSVTLNASFTSNGPSFSTPSGEVTWRAGNVVLGMSPILPSNGAASATLNTVLAPGTYSISVQVAGVSKVIPASVSVERIPTISSAVVSPTQPLSNGPITIRTTVVASSTAPVAPSGLVTLQEGGVSIASASLSALGLAAPVIPALSLGSHTIEVSYSGDAYFAPSSIVLTITIVGPIVTLSAASYTPAIAPQSIVSLYGSNLAAGVIQPTAGALPLTLDGVEVVFLEADLQLPAPLYFLSPNQVNAVVPALPAGTAQVQILNNGAVAFAGSLSVTSVAPGFFSANGNGKGVAAATLLTVDAEGNQSSQLIFSCASGGNCATIPLNVSDSSSTYYLTLYGTGFHAASQVSVTIGGTPTQVLYAGSQTEFPGLDQINVKLPSGLPEGIDLDISSIADGLQSNQVTIQFR
jgi:uncharacterized protein (TIGR03437 family)